MKIQKALYAAALLLVPMTTAAQESGATIKVEATKVEQKVTPYLYGSCIEDVNHEIYGGLYDQKIFGESFEEPIPAPRFEHFNVYDGEWSTTDGVLLSKAHNGAKIVSKEALGSGTVSVDIKFDKTGGHGLQNAGLLLCVSRPRAGADSFYGYEVSLASDGKMITIGKHKNNWEHIVDVSVNCAPTEWNNLKARVQNRTVEILLNNKSVCTFRLSDEELLDGSVALRVWNVDTRFANMKINDKPISLNAEIPERVSMQWDAVSKGEAVGSYMLDSKDAYNGRNSQMVELTSGRGAIGITNASLIESHPHDISISKEAPNYTQH